MSATKEQIAEHLTEAADVLFLEEATEFLEDKIKSQIDIAKHLGKGKDFDPMPILASLNEDGEIEWGFLPQPANTEEKIEHANAITSLLIARGARAAVMTMNGWSVNAEHEIKGVRPSQNPSRQEMVYCFGATRSGGSLSKCWNLNRDGDRPVLEEASTGTSFAGLFAAVLVRGVSADITDAQAHDIAEGKLIWPELEKPETRKPRTVEPTPGRNESCDCGSGRKAKKCCHR